MNICENCVLYIWFIDWCKKHGIVIKRIDEIDNSWTGK